MRYEKKMLILSEVNRGFSDMAARGTLILERTAYGVSCTLNVFHLKDLSKGEYLLGLTCGSRRTEVKHLGRTGKAGGKFDIPHDCDLSERIQCVIAHANGQEMLPVLFGSSDKKHVWQGNMLDGLTKKAEFFTPQPPAEPEKPFMRAPVQPEHRPYEYDPDGMPPRQESLSDGATKRPDFFMQQPPQQQPQPQPQPQPYSPAESRSSFDRTQATTDPQPIKEEMPKTPLFFDILPPENYEDAAVAAENYYPPEYGQELKIAGSAPERSAMPAGYSPFSKRRVLSEAALTEEPQPVSAQRITSLNGIPQPAAPAKSLPTRYYDRVKSQIDDLFKKYPGANELTKMLPDTKWVKVDYDGNGKYYVIGLIGDPPGYICYGVPAKYSREKPPELEGYCQWFPIDYAKPEDAGYWLMYQDAATGESVEVEII